MPSFHKFSPSKRVFNVLLATLIGVGASHTYCNGDELSFAAASGNVAKVDELIKKGVPLQKKDCSATPLHLASYHGFVDVVAKLLKAGASTMAVSFGQTPRQQARERIETDTQRIVDLAKKIAKYAGLRSQSEMSVLRLEAQVIVKAAPQVLLALSQETDRALKAEHKALTDDNVAQIKTQLAANAFLDYENRLSLKGRLLVGRSILPKLDGSKDNPAEVIHDVLASETNKAAARADEMLSEGGGVYDFPKSKVLESTLVIKIMQDISVALFLESKKALARNEALLTLDEAKFNGLKIVEVVVPVAPSVDIVKGVAAAIVGPEIVSDETDTDSDSDDEDDDK